MLLNKNIFPLANQTEEKNENKEKNMKQCLVLLQSLSFPVSTAFDSLRKISIGQFTSHQS